MDLPLLDISCKTNQHVPFDVCFFFPLNLMFSSFIHIVAHVWVLHFLKK